MTISRAGKARLNLQPINQQIRVTFTYNVHFTTGVFNLDNALLAQVVTADGERGTKKAIAIIDSGLLHHHEELPEQIAAYTKRYENALTLSANPVIISGGEAAKNNPKQLEEIHQIINEVGLCRHSYLLAIGGGAILDLAGYAAATAHRGIRLIRIPTTVLAQNDSGVGVKNGINAFEKKNFLGSFAPPFAVLNDFNFIKTLDERDWRSGIAEAVKVALIRDTEFFEFITTQAEALVQRDMNAMQQLIYRCAQLHLAHIANSGDPFEAGSSRPLDFGHWAAHKLEYLTNYNLRHGEAVAIGIALDSTYSYLAGLLTQSECQQILNTLIELAFTLYVPELDEQLHQPEHTRSLFRGLTEFREHLGGELTLMLLQGIGQGVEVHEVDFSLYRQAISILREVAENRQMVESLP